MIILLDEAYRPGVRNRYEGQEVRYFPSGITDPDALAAAMAEANVVGFRRVLPFAFEPRMALGSPNLQYLHRSGSGADWFDLALMTRLGILVAVNSGFNAPSVAEHTVLLTLLTLRRSLDYIDSMKQGQWLRDLPGPETFMLSGRTVGIVGVGHVGARMVRAMTALGAKVLCYQRDRSVALPDGAQWSELDALLAASDVVSLHVPLVDDTHHLIDARALGLMKSDAVLINTARGQVVDQQALISALTSGRLRAAGLDVFETEPLPAEHILRRLPNVVSTPHVGGAGVEIARQQVEGTLSNIDIFVAGGLPPRLVNPAVLRSDALRAQHLRTNPGS